MSFKTQRRRPAIVGDLGGNPYEMHIAFRDPGRVTVILSNTPLIAQGPPAQKVPAIFVFSTGGQPVNSEVIAFSNGSKSLGMTGSDGILQFDPKLLTDKGVSIASGTPIDIYTLTCKDSTIRVALAPSGTTTNQIGCADSSKPIVPSQECGCARAGGGLWGNDLKVTVPVISTGMSTGTKIAIFSGIGAGAIAGALAVTGGDDAGSTTTSSGPTLASASGNYPGLTFNQTVQTCNPARFGNSFNASATVVVEESGSVRITLIESATFILTGTLQRSGNTASGIVSGSGISAAGTPLSITATMTISLGPPPTLTFSNYVITNTAVSCNATFGSNSAQRSGG